MLTAAAVCTKLEGLSIRGIHQLKHKVIVRENAFRMSGDLTDAGIQEIYRALANDEVGIKGIIDAYV